MSLRDLFFTGGAASDDESGENDPNVAFYRNQIPSQPDGDFCDAIHQKWHGRYQVLEMHHGYIQWLFPVFENAGMNFESKPLSKTGAALIRADAACCQRVVKSYRLMLDFYGFVLADERTGRVARDKDPKERLENLNFSAHNWLRVSRILTSLGELGFPHYKQELIQALDAEVAAGTLANAAGSLERFWKPLCTGEDEAWYAQKTLEEPADRAKNVLFLRQGALAGDGAASAAAPAAPAKDVEPPASTRSCTIG